ncbi:hypothetical protein Q4I28_008281 [Leishmania naiffi]|uniref:Uncharacterized protein n=1 Tax=Leishmania naiffi TaxID=5678 RepID=A0AAW3B4P1_9TRYP
MNIQISGNLSKPTVVFIAGWPDTCDIFRDNIMATLAADHRIVGVTLPGFDDEHPFLAELRKRDSGATRNESRRMWRHREEVSTRFVATASTGASTDLPFRSLSSVGAVPRAHSGSKLSGGACVSTPLQSFGLPSCCATLEPFRTSWKGHSFQDLVTLLEIAVDTAMETCNYCPPVVVPTSAEAQGSPRCSSSSNSSGDTETAECSTAAFAAHQLPPKYTRPVIIAHDWGCLLAYELLLARPGLFSRIVALDVGAYLFESEAAHVERMCALVSAQDKGRPTEMAGNSFAAAQAKVSLETEKAVKFSISGQEDNAMPHITVNRDSHVVEDGLGVPSGGPTPTTTLLRRQSSSPPETLSSLVTIPHNVAPGGQLKAQRALSALSQMRTDPPSLGMKRSLASQYAFRRRKGTALPQRAETRKMLLIVLYQFFLITCELFVPHRLACWLLGLLSSLFGRPSYTYDPQMVATPTMELLNHTLNAQFFARHPFAIENRGALQIPMLLQTREPGSPSSSAAAAAAASLEASYGKNKSPVQPTTAGWKIMLIPYVEKTCVKAFPGRARSGNQDQLAGKGRRTASSRRSLYEDGFGMAFDGNFRTIHKSTHCGRIRRYSVGGSSATDSFASADGTSDVSEGNSSANQSFSAWEENTPADGAHVVFSSYAKGAHMVSDEWYSLPTGTRGIFGGSHVGHGNSGEFDPYTSVNGITAPVWDTDDPLTLTGAQSFMEMNRVAGVNNKDTVHLLAADGTLASGGGRADIVGVSSSPGSRQMHVAKRRLFYQAFVFPPLNHDAAGPSSSSFHSDLDDGASGRSSADARATALCRLSRPNRAASQHPAVPVRASPWQSWIYLRFWLGRLLLHFVALVTWLLGEHYSSQPSAVPGDGTAVLTASSVSGKVSSNVMTTAMTTIYRRLPATPSLAADVSTLPGNGDVVLQPKSYAPLVTQRYFVPLPIPILFMYGGEKRIMFHADHWCSYIRHYQRPRDGISDVVEVQGGGHWFFAEKKYQKKVADRIAEFLAAEPKTSYVV